MVNQTASHDAATVLTRSCADRAGFRLSTALRFRSQNLPSFCFSRGDCRSMPVALVYTASGCCQETTRHTAGRPLLQPDRMIERVCFVLFRFVSFRFDLFCCFIMSLRFTGYSGIQGHPIGRVSPSVWSTLSIKPETTLPWDGTLDLFLATSVSGCVVFLVFILYSLFFFRVLT
jgi:hypothetical protein